MSKTYSVTCILTEEDVRALASLPHMFEDEARLLQKISGSLVETPNKVYVPQRLNAFLAAIRSLPHDTEVCVESGQPAGWTYSAREQRVYIHQ